MSKPRKAGAPSLNVYALAMQRKRLYITPWYTHLLGRLPEWPLVLVWALVPEHAATHQNRLQKYSLKGTQDDPNMLT
jgi:hypothetical protein